MKNHSITELADALCQHFTEDSPRDAILSAIPRCADASFLAHYLNGPGADLVMTFPDLRWLTVRAEDIAHLTTVAQLHDLCMRHIVVRAEQERVN